MLTTLQCILTVCSVATVSRLYYYLNSLCEVRFALCIDGPTVEDHMTLSLLTPRDTETNIMFTLSFTVTHGPPSEIRCSRNGAQFFLGLTQKVYLQ